MIATVGLRIRVRAAAIAKWERNLERKIERRARPMLVRWAKRTRLVSQRWSRRLKTRGRRWGARASKRLRPAGVVFFRALAAAEAWLRKTATWGVKKSTQASAALTPERAACGVVVAASALLVVSQFIDYRGVEIGRPGYAGLPEIATPPTVGVKTAGSAHAYLLIPLALAAACLSVLALRPGRRRLGRIVFGFGLVSIAVILLVDLPAGLDAGAQATRFSGAIAVLDDGFYAELAASAGIALGGLLLALNPSGPRKPSLARTRGGKRSARTPARKKDGRPKTPPDDGLQRPATIPRRA